MIYAALWVCCSQHWGVFVRSKFKERYLRAEGRWPQNIKTTISKDRQRRISEIIFPSSQLMYEALSHVIGETLNSRCHGDKKLIGRLRHGRIFPRSKPPRT